MATLQIVTIGSRDYETYVDVAYADEYLDADATADAWRAADDDAKGRGIVTGGRVLDRLNWPGTKTDPDQLLAWPRTGVTGYSDDEIPQAIVDANVELAAASVAGIDIANFVTTATTEKSIKAGSVAVENFRQFGIGARQFPLPKPAWELIAGLLGVTSGSAMARASGTCGETVLVPDYGFGRPI